MFVICASELSSLTRCRPRFDPECPCEVAFLGLMILFLSDQNHVIRAVARIFCQGALAWTNCKGYVWILNLRGIQQKRWRCPIKCKKIKGSAEEVSHIRTICDFMHNMLEI